MKHKLLKCDVETAEGKAELSRLLGEVLPVEETCQNCQGALLCHSVSDDDDCGFKPDPIPLDDWNVAMKWRDWAVAEYGEEAFQSAMWKVFANSEGFHGMDYSDWLILKIQPEHYLIAAALCKINKENTNEQR